MSTEHLATAAQHVKTLITAPNPSAQIPALTGLRAAACLLVTMSHLKIPGSAGRFFIFERSGFCGVTFFFVLSGFVIAYNYIDSFRSSTTKSVVGYGISRFARIYPIYAFSIVAAWWWHQETRPLLPYLLALQAWHPDVWFAFATNGAAWSVGVEVFLYAMFPLMAWLVHRFNADTSLRTLACIGIVTASAMLLTATWFAVYRGNIGPTEPTSAHRWLYRMPMMRLGDFTLGMVAGLAVLRYNAQLRKLRVPWAFLGSVACLLVASMMTYLPLGAFAWDSAYAIPFTILILTTAVADWSRLARFFASRPLVVAGEMSYAFYLVHLPASDMWKRIENGSTFVNYTGEIIFIILLAAGLHFTVEKPGQRLIKRAFANRRAAAPSSASPGATRS